MLKKIRAFLGGKKKPRGAVAGEGAAPSRTGKTIHRGPKVVHRPISRSDLDPDAVKIVQRLTRFDHTAYLVGGCVRDLLLERHPKDFDIATSATPRQIKRLFRNCRIIGRRFRLAHIYFQNGKIIEVATFRALDEPDAGESDDGEDDRDLMIRDDNVFGSPEEDALRRDFTVNQLFYDMNAETVIDHADGLGDLRRKLVRTIGDPNIRFREDPVRSLRAIKFAARLDFAIERETLAALTETRRELEKAAPPRILEEINRFCRSGCARRSFELLNETGVFEIILPELYRGCLEHPEAWSMLIDLLREFDMRRSRDKREIRTGEMFAALVLPLLVDSFSWRAGASPEPIKAMDARDRIDGAMRPIALRLRMARREQEYGRQILATILRMVPAERVRRSTRRAIVHRACLLDAMWMLDVVSDRFGGAFTEAVDFWRSAVEGEVAEGAVLGEGEPEQDDAEPTTGGRRRRRRRSRRGRGGGGKESKVSENVESEESRAGAKSSGGGKERGSGDRKRRSRRGGSRVASDPKGASEAKSDMPPPWDDDYFFAALPSAPDAEGGASRVAESAGGDDGTAATGGTLAGAAETAPQAAETTEAAGDDAADGDASQAPRKRRRRRRGGRRRRRSDDDAAESEAGAGPSSGTAEPANS